jgi:hypothetical protein
LLLSSGKIGRTSWRERGAAPVYRIGVG